MSGISNVNNSLLQSQLAAAQLDQQISYSIAGKTLDAARNQGDMVLVLLDQAADVAKSSADQKPQLTYGALVSGLGQNLDVTA